MSENIRPAVEVFRDANIAFNKAWENTRGSAERVDPSNQAAAAVIEADREAVRAEQAAELAKFKALAETLAGALREIRRNHPDKSHTAMTANEALRQYKEARDETSTL